MAAVHVITDGTMALPSGMADSAGITIVPQNVIVGDVSYRGGVDLSPEELFELLATSTVHPTTSQASPGQFLEAYRRVLEWGVEIVSLHLPKSLSGTIDSARAALRMLPDDAPISIVETNWTSTALGLLALRAAEAGADGASRDDIVSLVDHLSGRMNLIFVVDDLRYLRRGGRIGAAAWIVGGMLQVKPLLELVDGQVLPVERVRTGRKALVRLAEIVGERLAESQGSAHIGLLSGAADAEAAALATFLEGRHHPAELWIAPCDPAVAVHTGPGVYGAAFYA